jgi:hypothetical protein
MIVFRDVCLVPGSSFIHMATSPPSPSAVAPEMSKAVHPEITPSLQTTHHSKISQLEKRILIFRLLTLLCLVGTGAICATLGYISLYRAEHHFFIEQYNSITLAMYGTQLQSINSRVSAGESFSAFYGGYCPSESNWPNCWVPYHIWLQNTAPLVEFLKLRVTSLLPMVQPSEVDSFESFARSSYEQEENFPPNAGYSPFGFGIFGFTNGSRYHDTTGETDLSPYDVLFPVFISHNSTSSSFLYNAHWRASTIIPLDEIMKCFETAPLQCLSTITAMSQLLVETKPRVSSLIFSPITPEANFSKLVGVATIVLTWDTILQSPPTSLKSHLIIVINSGTVTASFSYSNGEVEYLGLGDYHDSSLSQFERTYDLTPNRVMGSFNYTVSFYPTRRFYNAYHTSIPVYVCISAILIVLGTSLIFLVYDFFVKRESLEQTRILEAKQTYVRFISHVSSFLISSLPLLPLTLPPCVCVACVVCL